MFCAGMTNPEDVLSCLSGKLLDDPNDTMESMLSTACRAAVEAFTQCSVQRLTKEKESSVHLMNSQGVLQAEAPTSSLPCWAVGGRGGRDGGGGSAEGGDGGPDGSLPGGDGGADTSSSGSSSGDQSTGRLSATLTGMLAIV